MADREAESVKEEAEKLQQEVMAARVAAKQMQFIEDIDLLDSVSYLWLLWADFHVHITRPYIEPLTPAQWVQPEYDRENQIYERVYPICDYGHMLSTSRGEEMVSGLRSTDKLFNTVDKMIRLVVERTCGEQGGAGGGDAKPEVRIAFRGHELAQRKGFESVLNLEQNVVVVNFEPGEWGERYLRNVQNLVERGYGLPKASPRETFGSAQKKSGKV